MGDSMLLLVHFLMMAMFQVIMGILILGSEIGSEVFSGEEDVGGAY